MEWNSVSVGEGWAAWDVRSPRHTGGMDDAELTAAERLLLVRLYVAAAGQAGCCWTLASPVCRLGRSELNAFNDCQRDNCVRPQCVRSSFTNHHFAPIDPTVLTCANLPSQRLSTITNAQKRIRGEPVQAVSPSAAAVRVEHSAQCAQGLGRGTVKDVHSPAI